MARQEKGMAYGRYSLTRKHTYMDNIVIITARWIPLLPMFLKVVIHTDKGYPFKVGVLAMYICYESETASCKRLISIAAIYNVLHTVLHLQMIDPAALRPVRHAKLLRHKNHGICVSQQWLVAVDWDSNITVYSLPELQLRSWKQVSCYWHPCADSFGVIYLPYIGFVTMVEVSDNGNLTVLGKLNVGGRFKQKKRLISVAVGSQPGQLYMAGRFSSNFYLVNTTSDTIIHNLTLPNEITDVVAIAALNSGQILVATAYGRLALYPSVFEPAELLTNVPFYYAWVSANANANQFLVSAWGMSMLFVLDRNGSWDAVKALNGVDGVWVPSIEDVAVWEDCVWVADLTGSLILLCPL